MHSSDYVCEAPGCGAPGTDPAPDGSRWCAEHWSELQPSNCSADGCKNETAMAVERRWCEKHWRLLGGVVEAEVKVWLEVDPADQFEGKVPLGVDGLPVKTYVRPVDAACWCIESVLMASEGELSPVDGTALWVLRRDF